MSYMAGGPMIVARSATDWWTAGGTIALAVATFALVITTIVITRQDRGIADRRLHDERKDALEREQLAEARQVEVILGERVATLADIDHFPPATGEALKRPVPGRNVLTAAVINHGRYPITQIEQHLFVGEFHREVPFVKAERVTGDKARAAELLGGVTPFTADWVEKTVLTPWDTGLSLASQAMSSQDVPLSFVVVRWMD